MAEKGRLLLSFPFIAALFYARLLIFLDIVFERQEKKEKKRFLKTRLRTVFIPILRKMEKM